MLDCASRTHKIRDLCRPSKSQFLILPKDPFHKSVINKLDRGFYEHMAEVMNNMHPDPRSFGRDLDDMLGNVLLWDERGGEAADEYYA
jgi:hypothetical protein